MATSNLGRVRDLVTSVKRTSGTGAAGTTDTYTMTTESGFTATFDVHNGADGAELGGNIKSKTFVNDKSNREGYEELISFLKEHTTDIVAGFYTEGSTYFPFFVQTYGTEVISYYVEYSRLGDEGSSSEGECEVFQLSGNTSFTVYLFYWDKDEKGITIDDALDTSSTNLVQNQAIAKGVEANTVYFLDGIYEDDKSASTTAEMTYKRFREMKAVMIQTTSGNAEKTVYGIVQDTAVNDDVKQSVNRVFVRYAFSASRISMPTIHVVIDSPKESYDNDDEIVSVTFVHEYQYVDIEGLTDAQKKVLNALSVSSSGTLETGNNVLIDGELSVSGAGNGISAEDITIGSHIQDNGSLEVKGSSTFSGTAEFVDTATFDKPPVSATQPTEDTQVANKAYVDSKGYVTTDAFDSTLFSKENSKITLTNVSNSNGIFSIVSDSKYAIDMKDYVKIVDESGDVLADFEKAGTEIKNHLQCDSTMEVVGNATFGGNVILNSSDNLVDKNGNKLITGGGGGGITIIEKDLALSTSTRTGTISLSESEISQIKAGTPVLIHVYRDSLSSYKDFDCTLLRNNSTLGDEFIAQGWVRYGSDSGDLLFSLTLYENGTVVYDSIYSVFNGEYTFLFGNLEGKIAQASVQQLEDNVDCVLVYSVPSSTYRNLEMKWKPLSDIGGGADIIIRRYN